MVPEWMIDEDGGLNDCGIWTYDINVIPDLLANVVGAWMQDMVPEQLISAMDEVNTKYTVEKWEENVDGVMSTIINEQIKSFEQIKNSIKQKIINETKED